jgi:hypothetical protein
MNSKEQEIQIWLDQLKKPATPKDIYAEFGHDYEASIMAFTLAGIPIEEQHQAYCRGIDLSERLDKYSNSPLWFKTFIKQDVKTAIDIFAINRDRDNLAEEVILDWKDEVEYLNLVKNAAPFKNNEFEVTFKKIILNNEKNHERNIPDEFYQRITSGENLDFESEYDQKLFYFLFLQEFAEYSQADLKEMSVFAEKLEDYLITDVDAIAKITDKDVLFVTDGGVSKIFGGQSISLNRKEVKKELIDLLIDGAEDLEDSFAGELEALVGGRSLAAAKILYKVYKYAKKGKKVLDEIDISFDHDDEKDFYHRFMSQYYKGQSIKSFFIEEVKLPLQKFYIKNRLDFSDLDEAFFDHQFLNFINSRFYNKIYSLTREQQDEIEAEGHREKRDNLVFLYVSKKNLKIEERQSRQDWGL